MWRKQAQEGSYFYYKRTLLCIYAVEKIKLSTPHLRTAIFCGTSHLRPHSSTRYCKDVKIIVSETFTESECIFIKITDLFPSWVYCSMV